MEIIQGTSIFGGIVIGKISYFQKREQQVKRYRVSDVKKELERYEQAKEKAILQLKRLSEKAKKEVGEANAQLFEVHIMMMEDEDYKDSVYNLIEMQKINAEYAVARTGENFSQMFSEMEDDYFKARSVDVKDISERIIAALMGVEYGKKEEKEPSIIVASELTPSETIQMDKEKILAFVTETGSKNSHTAILARAMNIPAIIDVAISSRWDGKTAAVDGFGGKIYIDPDEETLKEMKSRMEEIKKSKEMLLKFKGKETVDRQGRKINLYANMGNKSDVAAVISNDAEGIGLFRTEFLYLEKTDFPSEEEQFLVYRYVAETMAGKKVIIRTMDIGADKQADYFGLEKEENPAMGYRAIRFCLKHPEIFKTQLRAILRASAYGTIAVMFPMIISLKEVKQAKELLEEAKQELQRINISYQDIEIGIMIETPAAVMISESLAKEVDFFSIGTNDLIQYTLAVDRQNQKLDDIYDDHHPAILEMIKMTVENGHRHGAWVGICGELAADQTLTGTFLEMGIDELSVAPSMILPLRKKIVDGE